MWTVTRRKSILTYAFLNENSLMRRGPRPRGERGYSHIQATWVCAAVRGMVFRKFSLGYGSEIRQF